MTNNPFPEYLGRYQIVRELGRGAMGVVYEGQDPHIGRRVAIKTAQRELITGPNASPDLLERFFREARVAGMLNHPNIITVYDAGEQDGTAFIAMEYIDGVDLGSRIAQGPRFSVQEAVELAATLAEALAFAHEQGVIHRDVKPANILLPKYGPPKLADFGIARVLDSTLTQEGSPLGTPSYMSPEQFTGQALDGRSDLFSLAVILYELLAAERPFTGAALPTIMHHILKTDPVPLHQLNFSLGETLSAAIMKALATAPQDRHPDGYAFAAALRTAVPMTSEAPTFPDPHEETARMNPKGFFADGAALPPEPRPGVRETVPGRRPSFPDRLGQDSGNPLQDDTDVVATTARRHHRGGLGLRDAALWLLLAVVVGGLFYFNQQPVRQPAPGAPSQSAAPGTPPPAAPSVRPPTPKAQPAVSTAPSAPPAAAKAPPAAAVPQPVPVKPMPTTVPEAPSAPPKTPPADAVSPPTTPEAQPAETTAPPSTGEAPASAVAQPSPPTEAPAPAAVPPVAPSDPPVGVTVEPSTPEEPPPPAPSEPPNVVLDTPGDPVEHPKLKVSVYATAEDRVYLEYQQILNGQGNTDDYIRTALASGRIQPLRGSGYSVVVYDPAKLSEPYSTESLTEDGNALVPIPEGTPKIKFEVHSGKEVLLPVELAAAVCQNSQSFVVVCPNCIPNPGNPSPAQ